ncbi:MAG: peptidoglycan editing factor PgeF [bacterium]
MKRIRNRIVRYQFTSLQRYLPDLRHFITTRMSGFSQKPYDTLNVGLHVGDDPANVRKNRSLVCRELGFGIDSMVAMQQSHSANIAIIEDEDKGRGALQREDGIEDTDGIVTNSKNIILSAMAADCSLNILYDPVKRVLALTHSGWKGIVSGVLKNTISAMVRSFGCHRGDILVGIGPTICERCFEVGDDLIDSMEKIFQHRMDAILSETRKGIQSINMIRALSMQLRDEGIQSDHIEVSDMCNACRTEEFFSYRMENKVTGRFGLFAVLIGDDKRS